MIGPYSDKFGFTQPDLDLILEVFDVHNHADIIRDWYNGYSYGGQTILGGKRYFQKNTRMVIPSAW